MTSQPTGAEKKRWIRPLPERLINKIAAGEVVERPAAVIKELVENALDSGATAIEIEVEKSGLKLMRIVDNGCGIPEDQIEIAFSRHATSKISDFADLDRIGTYGFRGEALPSIASVSRTRMVSRPNGADSAMEIVIEGGVVQSKQPFSGAVGTTIEVENLFFNTPARRKFLKSESAEARQISRVVTAMAISASAVAFTYRLNGREVFSLPGGQETADRASSLLTPGKEMIELNYEHQGIIVKGAIGLPDSLQANRLGQYIFLNERYIQSPSLSHALMAGYGELIPRGRFPIGAILITVDPSEVDVNVHPAKTEVRLAAEREVYRAVFHATQSILQQDKTIPTFQPRGQGYPGSGDQTAPASQSSTPGSQPQSNGTQLLPGMADRSHTPTDFMARLYRSTGSLPGEPPTEQVNRQTGEIITPASQSPQVGECAAGDGFEPEGSQVEGMNFVGRFGKLYLLFHSGSDLLIVDQHTAHERINYEKTLREIDRQAVVAQQMLFPEQIELSPERFGLFEEVSDLLNRSGFVISHFGGRMVNIEAIPSMLGSKSPEEILRRVLDDLGSSKQAGQDYRESMAASIACRAAVMSGDQLSEQEANKLIERLMECDNRYSCPHGRPTFVRLTREEINRQFGRA